MRTFAAYIMYTVSAITHKINAPGNMYIFSCIDVLNSNPKFGNYYYVLFEPKKQKQTPWPLVHERIIPTERPPLVDEI
jgi:hypothetical protein